MEIKPSEAIVGYVDPLITTPGDKTAVKVSCSRNAFSSQIFRLRAGYNHPDAPAVNHEQVEAIPQQTHEGKPQYSRIGSFASIPRWQGETLKDVESIEISFWCQATLPTEAGHEQYLFSSIEIAESSGFECFLDESGGLNVRVGGPNEMQEVKLSTHLTRYRWYCLTFTIVPTPGIVRLKAQAKARDIGESTTVLSEEHQLPCPARIVSKTPFVIASDSLGCKPSAQPVKSGSFNGKIDGFKVETLSGGKIDTLLDLDFSLDIPTDRIRDTSTHKHHGELISAPSRAVTGHDWDGSQSDWTRASYGYGAIHFHDDDLDDAMWETTFELELPKDLQSGCYGVFVDDGESTDIIPFFVRPDPHTVNRPPVALIIPSLTYAAYANERLSDESRTVHFGNVRQSDKYLETLTSRPDLGISLYDSHNDGSGAIFSTLKRAVVNMRPDYTHWLIDGPRDLSADLWFVDFLERELGAGGYDVITDHDINEFGAPLLNQYKVLLSCSHPEYPTYSMLDSYTAFLGQGGHFMYLGGNGYYWVTTHDPTRSHRIEVRRADAGCRTFGLPGGNWHHSLTGEPGSLWRSRGRPPNQFIGIGSCAEGVGKGAAYGITPSASSDPRLEPILRGLSSTTIGDYGLAQGAASGDEIDRLDYSLGSPCNAIMIATTKLAGGHSDDYSLFNEETLYPMVNTTGTTSDKVRSDIVLFETPSGGAVFSVGSIGWVGSMAWKAFDNDVARMTANTLHEFIRRSRTRIEKDEP